jgi:hypothetical protein
MLVMIHEAPLEIAGLEHIEATPEAFLVGEDAADHVGDQLGAPTCIGEHRPLWGEESFVQRREGAKAMGQRHRAMLRKEREPHVLAARVEAMALARSAHFHDVCFHDCLPIPVAE